jgi:hypothetical protein
MNQQPAEITDLDQPVKELSQREAVDVSGGYLPLHIKLNAIQDGTSNTIMVGEATPSTNGDGSKPNPFHP